TSQLSFSRWTELRLFGGVAFDHRRDRCRENGGRRERTQSQRVRRIFRSRQRYLSCARPLRIALRSPDVLLALDLQAQRGRRAQTRDVDPLRLRAQKKRARRKEFEDGRDQARRKRPCQL